MNKPTHGGGRPDRDRDGGGASGVPGKSGDGVLGIWLNKRHLTGLEVPFRHQLTAEHGGWRLTALEPGKLTARLVHGEPMRIDLDEGDQLSSSADDFYLSLHRVPPPEEPEPDVREPEPEPRKTVRKKG